MTRPEPRYPFVVPGHEIAPNQPLCPWNDGNVADHERYYRDVGGHAEAYSGFTTEVGAPESLCQNGAVVVVGGPPRSGKSSLINRCIKWIHDGAHDVKESPVHILDFSSYQPPGPSVEERTAKVAELIRIKLAPLKKPNWMQGELGDKRADNIESVLLHLYNMRQYDQLRHCFIIVPPPLVSDSAQQEVKRYRACVQPGIICMLEHVTGQNPPPSDPPTRLALRHLEPDEAYRMVQEWPDTTTASPPILKKVPPILEDVMTEFESYFTDEQGGSLSAGQLLATLREVYRRRIRDTSQSKPLDSIGLQEVLKTFLWVVQNQSGGQGNSNP